MVHLETLATFRAEALDLIEFQRFNVHFRLRKLEIRYFHFHRVVILLKTITLLIATVFQAQPDSKQEQNQAFIVSCILFAHMALIMHLLKMELRWNFLILHSLILLLLHIP